MFAYVAGTCAADGNCSGRPFRRPPQRRRRIRLHPVDCDDGDAAPDDTSGVFIDMHSNAALVLWPWGDTVDRFAERDRADDARPPHRLVQRLHAASNRTSSTSPTARPTTRCTACSASPRTRSKPTASISSRTARRSKRNTAPTNLDALRYIARNAARALPAALRARHDPASTVGSDLVVPAIRSTSARISTAAASTSRTAASRCTTSQRARVSSMRCRGTAATPDRAAGRTTARSIRRSKSASATIATDGLAAGRHFVYVQGTDVERERRYAERGVLRRRRCRRDRNARRPRHRSGERRRGRRDDQRSPSQTTAKRSTTTAMRRPATTARTRSRAHSTSRVSAPHYMAQTVDGIALAAGGTVTQTSRCCRTA